VAVQELAAQRAMKPLHLAARGRRMWCWKQVADATLTADAVEQRRGGKRRIAAGEHLAVVGEDLIGNSVTLQGCVEPCAHRARVGSRHHRGAHTEAGVV